MDVVVAVFALKTFLYTIDMDVSPPRFSSHHGQETGFVHSHQYHTNTTSKVSACRCTHVFTRRSWYFYQQFLYYYVQFATKSPEPYCKRSSRINRSHHNKRHAFKHRHFSSTYKLEVYIDVGLCHENLLCTESQHLYSTPDRNTAKLYIRPRFFSGLVKANIS